MTSWYIDTNILLDIILDRGELQASSSKVLEILFQRGELRLSTLTVHIVMYFAQKYRIDKNKVKELINSFALVPLPTEIITEAFRYDDLDFEDLLHYLTAKHFNCKAIVTRDKEDFLKIHQKIKAPIKIISPEEIL